MAGGAGKDDEPEPPREPDAAGEGTSPDHHAPASPGASEEEEGASGAVEAGQDDAPELDDDQEEGGDGTEDDVDEDEEEEGDGEEEEEEEEGDEDEEDAPTHLPFEPSEEESLEETTTVDPSYTISLIRQLIPEGSSLEEEFRDPSEKSDKQGLPEERSVSPKDQWEECGYILWELAASTPQAELMINNLVIEVLLENLRTANSSRVKEICLGIMGNLVCHESLVAAISLKNGLIATVVEQLFLNHVKCLSESFRLLAAILQSSASVSWAQALLPDEILSRILLIVGKTDSTKLLEKIIDFLTTVIDNRGVIGMLIQPLLKLGLVDRLIGLLTNENEIERPPDEKLDRKGSLDLILHFMEESSAIHSVSKAMTSNDRLIKVLVNMIKSPDKVEVASYCTSVVIVISNILTDGKHLVPKISHDLPFLEGLLEVLPAVPDDDQARCALWSILSCILAQVQGTKLNSSSLDQFASLFLVKFGLIKADLESQVVDEEKLTPEDALLKRWISTCLMAISFFMVRWIEQKPSQGNEDAIDNAREVLSYCQNMLC